MWIKACLTGVLFAVFSTAQSAPIHWTLTGVVFDDGDELAGSFAYDADSNTFSDVAISLIQDSEVSFTYTALFAGGSTAVAFVEAGGSDLTDQGYLQLGFYQFPLTNAGGAISLVDPMDPAASQDGVCLDITCSSVSFGRTVVAGAIIGTPAIVPVPGAAWLFGSAVGLMGAMRRKISS